MYEMDYMPKNQDGQTVHRWFCLFAWALITLMFSALAIDIADEFLGAALIFAVVAGLCGLKARRTLQGLLPIRYTIAGCVSGVFRLIVIFSGLTALMAVVQAYDVLYSDFPTQAAERFVANYGPHGNVGFYQNITSWGIAALLLASVSGLTIYAFRMAMHAERIVVWLVKEFMHEVQNDYGDCVPLRPRLSKWESRMNKTRTLGLSRRTGR